jgi:alpha-L-fucosidase
MEVMGEWLQTYGETVYGTEAGDVKQQQWGCTTRNGDKLYVHIFELEDEMLYLPLECKVSSAKVFVSGEPVKFEKVAKGVVLNLGKLPAMTDYVVELTTK